MVSLCWYRRCSIYIVSFFKLNEVFPVFICANNIGSLVNNLFGVNIFNPFSFFTSYLSPSSGDMSGISINLLELTPSSEDVSDKSLSSYFVLYP